MQLIPALDLLGNDAVRLHQGSYDHVLFRQPVEDFMARIVATEPSMIHIVDLEGARDGEIRTDVIARCVAVSAGIPLQVSGGIRSLAAAHNSIAAGASRVIIGTAVWEDREALGRFVDSLGEQLLVAFDVKDGQLAIRGWQESTGLNVEQALAKCVEEGVKRLHVTAVERDGTMRGPNLELYKRVCQSGIPVIAAGGVRDDRDVEALAEVGCEAAVMGLAYLTRLGPSLNA